MSKAPDVLANFTAVPSPMGGTWSLRRPLLPAEPHGDGEACRYVSTFYGTGPDGRAPNGRTSEENARRAADRANVPDACASCGSDGTGIIRRAVHLRTAEGFANGPEDPPSRWTENVCDMCAPDRRRAVSLDGAPRAAGRGSLQGGALCDAIAVNACDDGCETVGEMDGPGHFAVCRGPLTAEDVSRIARECAFGPVLPCEMTLLTGGAGWIAHTDSQGFVSVERHETAGDLELAWASIETAVAEWYASSEGDEDEADRAVEPQETETGYVPCRCSDCMETAIATIGRPAALCHACEDAGCDPCAETECAVPGAYGVGDEPENGGAR